MSLAANALVTLADLEGFLGPTFGADTAAKAQAERAINVATQTIERMTGRIFINTSAVTEYHTLWDSRSRIHLLDWPIQSITSIYEDPERGYDDSDDLLTADTDYIKVAQKGELIRVWEDAGERPWCLGFRAIRVIYTPGYASTTAVPTDLSDLCLEMAARLRKEAERETWGLQGKSDSAGNWTRFAPSLLTKEISDRIAQFGRPKWDRTGERDS